MPSQIQITNGTESSSSKSNGFCSSDFSSPPIQSAYCGDLDPFNLDEDEHASLNGVEGNGTGCLHMTRTCSADGPLAMKHHYVKLTTKIQQKMENNEPFFSLEFFPPRTASGVSNLFQRIELFEQFQPLFIDVTWHPSGDPGNLDKETSSCSIAGGFLNFCRAETMLHVTCTMYTRAEILDYLNKAKSMGIRNILALRGDLPFDEDPAEIVKNAELPYASDLVRLIRDNFGDYFVIGVAGYPCGHPEASSYEADLQHLKDKVVAGADFVITQLFFSTETYFQFVKDSRALGIDVPIIPGVMPIQSYESLRHITRLSKLKVPQFILDAVEPIKQNDAAIRNYGIALATDMCRELLNSGLAPGIHFYTLNRQIATVEIIKQLGYWPKVKARLLPWKCFTSHHKRNKEDVRPIFWSLRPKSYVYRTKDWDDFPNGRWGNVSSPAFGELKDYYLFCLNSHAPKEKLLDMWGRQIDKDEDVWNVFTAYITGQANSQGHKVTRLPWNEEESLAGETLLLKPHLVWCNKLGILTINSQPNVNTAPSNDPVVGWGSPGGYVYQKAYLEFFVRRELADALLKILPRYPQVHFHVINHDESVNSTNCGQSPLAVTWGVFPGTEIQQPTVVDPVSFGIWKDEAFQDWLVVWAKIYPEGSVSREVLKRIHDTYCLVNLVDNEFPKPSCLWDLLQEMVNTAMEDHQ